MYILEIGTFLGYSALCLEKGLKPGGELHTIEIDEETAAAARENFKKSKTANKIILHTGNALELLNTLHYPWDLIFIDADKQSIPHYLEWSLKLSHLGTLIIVDNVIRDGALIDAKSEDPNVIGARRMHEMLAAEPRLSATTIQTVGSKGYDGLTLALVIAG